MTMLSRNLLHITRKQCCSYGVPSFLSDIGKGFLFHWYNKEGFNKLNGTYWKDGCSNLTQFVSLSWGSSDWRMYPGSFTTNGWQWNQRKDPTWCSAVDHETMLKSLSLESSDWPSCPCNGKIFGEDWWYRGRSRSVILLVATANCVWQKGRIGATSLRKEF